MTSRSDSAKAVGTSTIPDKLYFRIGEVAVLCEVPTYVLRFWESEFPQLKPNKGGTGQRLYRRRDVEMALRIKTLLYDEGFTIPGARQTLKTEQRQKEPQLTLAIVESEVSSAVDRKALRTLQNEMRDLLKLLSATPSKGAIHSIRSPRASRPSPPINQSTDDLFG
jgi:DNA-binding transcriptional MerR regulator